MSEMLLPFARNLPLSDESNRFVEWINREGIDRKAHGAIGPRALLSFLVAWFKINKRSATVYFNEHFPGTAEEALGFAIGFLEQNQPGPVSGWAYLSEEGQDVLRGAQELVRTLKRSEVEPYHIYAALLARAAKDPDPDAFIGSQKGRVQELRDSFLRHVQGSGYGEASDYWQAALPIVSPADPQNPTKPTPASQSPPSGIGNGIRPSREAADGELCLNIDAYALAIADTFKAATDESDFVFALYGPWGRGKSTLIKQVAKLLEREQSIKVGRDYRSISFSAWRYPTRPEVWIHLYQKIAEAAQDKGFWQKLRIGFRIGLIKHGWSRLITGFALLAASRLQFELAHWLYNGLGIIGLIIIGSFVWSASNTGKKVAQSYFAIPDHADKLGLQAVIGRDLRDLLQVWTFNLRDVVPEDGSRKRCDFSFAGTANRNLAAVVLLIWLALGLVCWKLHRYAPAAAKGATGANTALAVTSAAPVSISMDIQRKGTQLAWTNPVALTPVEKQQAETQDRSTLYWMDGLLALIGLSTALFARAISRAPDRPGRVLLIVDDLDRCGPEQMLSVIESLRLFLEEADMSRRMQVAMLMDKRALEGALTGRLMKSPHLADKGKLPVMIREQREKYFVAELTLPDLSSSEVKDVAIGVVDGEYRRQLEASLEKANRDAEAPAPHTRREHVQSGTTPVKVMRAGRGEVMEVGGDPIYKDMEIKPTERELTAHAERVRAGKKTQQELQAKLVEVSPASAANQNTASKPSEEQISDMFSEEERDRLKSILEQSAAVGLTPRSIRGFVFRYQLARLLLQSLGHPYSVEVLVKAMAEALFSPANEKAFSCPEDIHWAVKHVV